jgi:L-asparaginase / beta-aspartyl-peptidase
MLRERPTLLVSEGARRFAADRGAELCDPAAMIAPKRSTGAHDTVGCVARDRDGNIAAGTSTGGLPGAAAGRVGDSPLPGGGLYADSSIGGVSLSGDGESISRVLLAARVMRELEDREPEEAVTAGLRRLDRVGGEAGAIAIDCHGRFGWDHNSSRFAVAMMRADMPAPVAWLSKTEAARERQG